MTCSIPMFAYKLLVKRGRNGLYALFRPLAVGLCLRGNLIPRPERPDKPP
jgi:hypothetical protein